MTPSRCTLSVGMVEGRRIRKGSGIDIRHFSALKSSAAPDARMGDVVNIFMFDLNFLPPLTLLPPLPTVKPNREPKDIVSFNVQRKTKRGVERHTPPHLTSPPRTGERDKYSQNGVRAGHWTSCDRHLLQPLTLPLPRISRSSSGGRRSETT